MKPLAWRHNHYHSAQRENISTRSVRPALRDAAGPRIDQLTTNKLEAVRNLYRELREADKATDTGAPEARFAAMATKSAGLMALKTLCESLPPDLRSRMWAVGSFWKG